MMAAPTRVTRVSGTGVLPALSFPGEKSPPSLPAQTAYGYVHMSVYAEILSQDGLTLTLPSHGDAIQFSVNFG